MNSKHLFTNSKKLFTNTKHLFIINRKCHHFNKKERLISQLYKELGEYYFNDDIINQHNILNKISILEKKNVFIDPKLNITINSIDDIFKHIKNKDIK